MSKNKYRLTKVTRKKDGKKYKVEKIIENGKVKLIVSEEFVKKNKVEKNIEIDYENEMIIREYRNSTEKNRIENMLSKITNKSIDIKDYGTKELTKQIKNKNIKLKKPFSRGKDEKIVEKINKMFIPLVQEETSYNNRFLNSIPFSINYYQNSNKREIIQKLVSDNNLEIKTKEKYNILLGKREQKYYNINIKLLKEKKILENKKFYVKEKMQENRRIFLESKKDKEKDFDFHYEMYIMKSIFNIICRRSYKIYEDGKKSKDYISFDSVYSAFQNKITQNIIDIGNNNDEVKNSIDLELKRQNNKFFTTFMTSINRIENNLLLDYPIIDKEVYPFDLFSKEDQFKNLEKNDSKLIKEMKKKSKD